MKIKSNRETLIKGIQSIQSNTSSKTGTITILQNFLMETENDELKLVFTDLEMAVKHYIKVSIDQEGSITLPLKKFTDILHVLNPEDEISINVDKASRVTILSGKSRFSMGGIVKSEYPVIPDVDEANVFRIPALKLAGYLSKTIFAASNESERQFLSGLLFANDKKSFSIVATDGKRLAVLRDTSLNIKQNFKIIVPAKVLNELIKFINLSDFDEKQDVSVSYSQNQVAFKIGKTLFISRLVDGKFPDYEQIIPKSSEISISMDSEKILNLTKKALVCANERTGSVKYVFKKNILIVQASSPNMEFEDETEIEYAGKEFEISFKPKYIVDVLKVVNQRFTFKVNSSSMPVLIKPEGEDNFLYIMMPLRT